MMEDTLFAAKQVTSLKSHRFRKNSFRLSDINFTLPKGYIMGLIGKNGAGKTTFFDYIMDAKKRYSGKLLLEGKEIHENHVQALDQIGFVSEKNKFMDLRTAKQNAAMLGPFYSAFDMDCFENSMEQLQLSTGKTVGRMSRGELIKFQLSFAASHHPKLFLLDEATAGMDSVFRIDFYKLLHQLIEEENCSVMLSTHLEEEIERQLDYVGVLEEGRFISFGENELT